MTDSLRTDIKVYFAPMEGLTDAAFRRVHYSLFRDADAYYLPFISPTQNLVLNGREKRNVLKEYNAGVPCVPQILTKDPEHFLWAADLLADQGFTEINLNAGCPSATVTAKGKGAGLLKNTEDLRRLLDRICTASPLPVSVKTRIGFESADEWEALLPIYADYPLKRLIVHPRSCRENYDPFRLHRECFIRAAGAYKGELIYNGDVFSAEDAQQLQSGVPCLSGVMCGRGWVADPALGREIIGGAPLNKEEVILFHDTLAEEWQRIYQGDIVFMKLRVVMKHLACCFENIRKNEKKIRKTRDLKELLQTDRQIFNTCDLRKDAAFIPDEILKEQDATHI
ncbi:MAG: hypothetical protein CW338_02610 [Clostridiales bacterium]|nr:hypothetical protein [Clostridiales bacterium]